MAFSARTARLSREIKNLETKPPWGIKCCPEKDDIYDNLSVTMNGPRGSPYEKGLFKLIINVPDRYPFEPPLVKFITPVYHPNIDKGKFFIYYIFNLYTQNIYIYRCSYFMLQIHFDKVTIVNLTMCAAVCVFTKLVLSP